MLRTGLGAFMRQGSGKRRMLSPRCMPGARPLGDMAQPPQHRRSPCLCTIVGPAEVSFSFTIYQRMDRERLTKPISWQIRVLRLVRCPGVQVLRERVIADLNLSYLDLQLEDYPCLVIVFKILPEAATRTPLILCKCQQNITRASADTINDVQA